MEYRIDREALEEFIGRQVELVESASIQEGVDAWRALLGTRECGVVWRAGEIVRETRPGSSPPQRRDALARAGAWLGTLPPRLALEQEDAVQLVAERCGYSAEAAKRSFRARFWRAPTHEPEFALRHSPRALPEL